MKIVMDKMHGGEYRWTWKRFKTAMRNMGCRSLAVTEYHQLTGRLLGNLDYDYKETIEVEARPSLLWWFAPKPAEEPFEPPPASPVDRAPIRTSENSFWLARKIRSSPPCDEQLKERSRPPSIKSQASMPTIISYFTTTTSKDEPQAVGDEPRPPSITSQSSTAAMDVISNFLKSKSKPVDDGEQVAHDVAGEQKRSRPPSVRSQSSGGTLRIISNVFPTFNKEGFEKVVPPDEPLDSTSNTEVVEDINSQCKPDVLGTGFAKAPTWLLDVCQSLDTLQTEHPKAMSMLSAILITAGTLPTLPVVAASAGTGVLATSAFKAAGVVALGVGNWLQGRQVATEEKQGEGGELPSSKSVGI